jgi:hypothetical protein
MQYIITYATTDTNRDDFYGYDIVVVGLLLTCGVSVGKLPEEVLLKEYGVRLSGKWTDSQSIVRASEMQV